MSATVSNLPVIAQWLNAVPMQSDWRPVPLHQFIKSGARVLAPDGQEMRTLGDAVGDDNDHVAQLCREVCCDSPFSLLTLCAGFG